MAPYSPPSLALGSIAVLAMNELELQNIESSLHKQLLNLFKGEVVTYSTILLHVSVVVENASPVLDAGGQKVKLRVVEVAVISE